MTIIELNKKGIEILKQNKKEDSNIKANVLLQYVLKKNKQELLIKNNEEVEKEKEEIYLKYIEEIIQGKPLQYITNKQEFMGLDFFVDENVLIPQPDTEILVEEAIKEIENIIKENKIKNDKETMEDKTENNQTIKVLDLCTGSGAIAIAIAKHLEGSRLCNQYQNSKIKFEIYASDISKEALEVARKNAILNEVQIYFVKSDMFENIENHYKKLEFNIIISNPPYIEDAVIETLSKEVQNEPYIALAGGKDGLDFYRIIANKASQFLQGSGQILLEIGYNQKESVTKLFQDTKQYDTIKCIKDLAGNDRVIKSIKKK